MKQHSRGATHYNLADLPGHSVALNDAGQVVGTVSNPVNNFILTYYYQAGAVSTFGSGREAVPVGINAAGQAVGWWTAGGDNPTVNAFTWDGSTPAQSISEGFSTALRPSAINDEGVFVGTFNEGQGHIPSGPSHAFSAQNGMATIFDPPGAATSSAADINNAGQIVGSYTDPSGRSHAFLDESGTFTTTDPSGAVWAQATHINASGVVIGEYAVSGENPPDQEHAFIYDHGTISALNQTGTPLSVATAINAAGEVVGYYGDASQTHAFAYQNGIFRTIDPPGATSSAAIDVNDLGQIVGNYTDGAGAHVFIYGHGAFSTIDEPGATSISAAAINNVGQVIGNYTDDTGGGHGFIANPVGSMNHHTHRESCFSGDGGKAVGMTLADLSIDRHLRAIFTNFSGSKEAVLRHPAGTVGDFGDLAASHHIWNLPPVS